MPDRPTVHVDPTVRFGKPQIRGISTEVIADMYWAGEAPMVICDKYSLTLHELLAALWFEGTHGQPRFRRRWKTWAADVAYPRLAGWVKPLDVGTIPLPPDVFD